jgi:EAL domain-containing protein (putative c-di-GMP-specific phosphodiesterase class I)
MTGAAMLLDESTGGLEEASQAQGQRDDTPAPADAADTAPSGALVLLVDDDVLVARAYARVLRSAGYTVEVAHDGAGAIDRCRDQRFDVVISDVAMPGMNGLQLLRAVREHDLDVPVILMTGGPNYESAVRALEYGAHRYLVKPVRVEELEEVVSRAVRIHHVARLRREALELVQTGGRHLGERAGTEVRFGRALGTLWMAYQPIVSCARQRIFAYEALVRNEEPTLKNPLDLFDAAERLGRVHELGRAIRLRVAATIRDVPTDAMIFVNLHPHDLSDDDLEDPAAPLTRYASRVVLEITERAALDQVPDLTARVARLRAMGFRIAVDDLGAGYAGLASFAQLEPDVVKLDMSLIREIDRSFTKQKLIHSIVDLCRSLGIRLIAEGIETEGERDAVLRLGGDLCQGYLFAHPGLAYPTAAC